MNSRAKIVAPIVIVVVMALSAIFILRNRNDVPADGLSASGTVEATEADLGFQTGGRVAELGVREGDIVSAGQQIATLDVADVSARLKSAEAQVKSAQATLAELQRGSRPAEKRQADAAATVASERVQEARRSFDRAVKLFNGGAISREARDQAETAYNVARAQLEQVKQQENIVDEGPRVERIAAQQAVVQQAQAAADQVRAVLDQSVIRAPFAGVVTMKHREAGETVSPGLPVVSIMNASDRWVRIYIREDQIGRVHIGQAASITSDTDPKRAYTGRVTFIASQAEFTPRNVQTTEERVKLVYAVKVAITGDTRSDLKPGVPADVKITADPVAAR